MKVIPLTSRPDRYQLVVTVDGQDVGIRVYWLPRCAGWYADLLSPSGVEIATAARITPGALLAWPTAGEGVPPGRFLAVGPDDYGHDDLGTQVQIWYLTGAEVDALRASG